MKQEVFWQTTVDMPGDSTLTSIPERVDVAIIGGGYTGLCAARTLAKNGTSVVVLEAQTVGWGASSRNGGMALTGLKSSMQSVVRKYGGGLARKLFQISLNSVDAVERIVNEDGIDCGFNRSGHLVVANKPRHFKAMKEEVEFMARDFNHRVRLVPEGELKNEIGSSAYRGGIVDEYSAGLNPAQYVAGLAGAAVKAGALLCARAPVTKIQRGSKRFILYTDRGIVRAESVLVATSGYTGSVTRILQNKIIPIGSYIIATEKINDDLAKELNPKNRMIFDYKHYLNYFRIWDNRLIFGGRAAFYPEAGNTVKQSAQILRSEMVGVYPQLKDVKIEYAWGGTLDFAFDQMTHVGVSDGMYYSLGYAGHGVAMATILGVTVAEAMLDGNIADHPFAQLNFPNAPLGLYDGRPWFLPYAGLWYRILDLIE